MFHTLKTQSWNLSTFKDFRPQSLESCYRILSPWYVCQDQDGKNIYIFQLKCCKNDKYKQSSSIYEHLPQWFFCCCFLDFIFCALFSIRRAVLLFLKFLEIKMTKMSIIIKKTYTNTHRQEKKKVFKKFIIKLLLKVIKSSFKVLIRK